MAQRKGRGSRLGFRGLCVAPVCSFRPVAHCHGCPGGRTSWRRGRALLPGHRRGRRYQLLRTNRRRRSRTGSASPAAWRATASHRTASHRTASRRTASGRRRRNRPHLPKTVVPTSTADWAFGGFSPEITSRTDWGSHEKMRPRYREATSVDRGSQLNYRCERMRLDQRGRATAPRRPLVPRRSRVRPARTAPASSLRSRGSGPTGRPRTARPRLSHARWHP